MSQDLFSFQIPTIVPLPEGYDLNIIVPDRVITDRLAVKDASLTAQFKVIFEGTVIRQTEYSIEVSGGRLLRDEPMCEAILEDDIPEATGPCFVELSLAEKNEKPVFASRLSPGWYSIFNKPGKKSFFSDNAPKYGAPPIIGMIAEFHCYVEGYPVVHLDRTRDLGESLLLINPYNRPIVADVVTHDGRRLPRTKVPPASARWVRLAQILREDEDAWLGQIQLTASNRLVTYETKHSFSDPRLITDHEHLDPFRADPTHLPATLKGRIVLGGILSDMRHRRRAAAPMA